MLLSVADSRRSRNVETKTVSSLFPEAITENASVLISFIEKYYEYINSSGLPSGELSMITTEKDIDLVSNKYLTQIQSLIARNVPESTILDKTSLYKIILNYYRTRGSEDSVYAFFKLFFNEFITIFYPRDYLFELSQGSGQWRDVDFSLLRTVEGNPNKTRMRIASNVEVGPRGFGLNPNQVELIYFNSTTWTYTGNEINTQYPYLTKQLMWFGEYRWLFEYNNLKVYSDNDSVWPDEAKWSAREIDIYFQQGESSIKKLHYDKGNTWSLVGREIEGDEINATLGNSVSLSADAKILAIGSSYTTDETEGLGHSRVYRFNSRLSSWQQIGQDLTANFASKNISYDLLLSADGTRVTVTAADPIAIDVGIDYGVTRVYEYVNGVNRWRQLGQEISPSDFFAQGEFISQKNDNFIVEESDVADPQYNAQFVTQGGISSGDVATFRGTSSAFSGDGSTVAVTYLFITSTTLIYRYNSSSNQWEKIGTIYSDQSDDLNGYSMSLNHDGNILALGAPDHDNNGLTDTGSVTVYRYDSALKSWKLFGNKLASNINAGENYGFSVSLNSSGNVLAVGATGGYNQTEPIVQTGYTRIYSYNPVTNLWSQLGQTIYGSNAGDFGGYSVSLNSFGNICAVGYHKYDSYYQNQSSLDSGIVRVYEYSDSIQSWIQLSNSIEGQFSLDSIGTSLSISSDGLTVATGSIGWQNDPNGAVHVYSLDPIRDFKFASEISVTAVPEFAFSYGELINSLENFDSGVPNTLYKTVNLTPIVWEKSEQVKQWVPSNNKSFASNSYKLHDGYYWQKYSYDIKTSKPAAEWLDDYLKFVHPAGLQLFASILVQLMSAQSWKTKIDYSATKPQLNFSWITNQRAPRGAHSPQYQPGWLTFNERLISIFIEKLQVNEGDRNLYNLVYHVLKFYSTNKNFRDKSVRKEYQNWLKFLDSGEIISGYLNKTIDQANEDYSLSNACKFSNVSTDIKIISSGRYLEDTYPRNIEARRRMMRLLEEETEEYNEYVMQLQNGETLNLENSEQLFIEKDINSL